MLFDLPRPVIYAHRGASAYAPENTIAAFHIAQKQGAIAVEFDVKLSADGAVVLLHDQTVDRTTDGSGDLRDLTLPALRELDAGKWFGEQFCNIKIPTLGEVFEEFGKKLFMNIELTNYLTPTDNLVEKVAERIISHGLQGNILFSSFNPQNLAQAERLLPEIPRGLLIPTLFRGRKSRRMSVTQVNYQAIHPYFLDIRPGWVKRVQRMGKRVHVWTVNHIGIMRILFKWGVDGIFTDDPALGLRLLGE